MGPRPILNRSHPGPPWTPPDGRQLPGVAPLDMREWIWVRDSYAAQMAERERLLAEVPEHVHRLPDFAMLSAQELFDLVLTQLAARSDFVTEGAVMRCPDGRRVKLDRSAPLLTLGRLVQEDLCLLVKPDGAAEHQLSAAVLCFPAGWTLAEKLDRPLSAIHAPVPAYDAGIARRVQRLLDGVQPGRPLWRGNVLRFDSPDLFQPRPEHAPAMASAESPYVRSERQCLVRLPKSGAVVFSIHTMLFAAGAADGVF